MNGLLLDARWHSLVWHGGDSGCPHAGPDLISDDTSQVFHGCESWTTSPADASCGLARNMCKYIHYSDTNLHTKSLTGGRTGTMPTSELSDALNPYYAQSRSRSGQHAHNTSQLPPASHQPASQHTPHRAQSDFAMVGPARAPETP